MKHYYLLRAGNLITILLLVLYPVFFYAFVTNAGISYVLTTLVYALPFCYLLSLIPKKWGYITVMSILTIVQIIEYSMVVLYDSYLLSGGIVSTLNTNAIEASEFFNTNVKIWYQWLPIIFFFALTIITYQKPRYSKTHIICFCVSIIIPICFVTGKLVISYKSKITVTYFINNRVWNRPPYNFGYQLYNTYLYKLRHDEMKYADDKKFGACKKERITEKEIYVLAIGESLRYDNLSLNGIYGRETTPRLSKLNNLILFDNYYSTACLTMFSVPMLMTRATPSNYELNYAEKSIFEPFKECGFKTYAVISKTNLLSYETYLTDGVDSLFLVPNIVKDGEILSGDKTIVHIIDSLINTTEKIFIICQFMGNHAFFTNYEKEYNIYRPNSNTDKGVDSDSLLINSYDNSILYTDYILSSIIHSMDKPNTISGFSFISDHGEHIDKTGAGHGGDCSPKKMEYHVPYIVWCSDTYIKYFGDKWAVAQSHKKAKINADNLFYSICDMAGMELDSAYTKTEWSVFSNEFKEHERDILLPDGVNYITVE